MTKFVDLNITTCLSPGVVYTNVDNITVCQSNDFPYNDFFQQFICKNIPCVVQKVTRDWECYSKWIKDNKPDIKLLLSKYSEMIVTISDCTLPAPSGQRKLSVSFQEYISKYYKPGDGSLWYLKDWHLKRQNPRDLFYSVPEYFASDWLNEYAVDNNVDDFMFVYLGPKGSWSPFHADVYSSFSWSVNVVGKKKWLLFPPGEQNQFLDNFGNYPQDVEPLITKKSKYFEIIQNQGDALFVPSEWHHQVVNMEDTISINHNWVNASNIHIMWKSLVSNMRMVEKEIEEFKGSDDWADHCQVMLKALFGVNFKDFFNFVTYIAKKRLQSFAENTKVLFEDYVFGKNHILFDLSAAKNVMQIMNSDLHYNEEEQRHLLEMINNINYYK